MLINNYQSEQNIYIFPEKFYRFKMMHFLIREWFFVKHIDNCLLLPCIVHFCTYLKIRWIENIFTPIGCDENVLLLFVKQYFRNKYIVHTSQNFQNKYPMNSRRILAVVYTNMHSSPPNSRNMSHRNWEMKARCLWKFPEYREAK